MNKPDQRDWQWEEFHNHHHFNDDDGEEFPDVADDSEEYLQKLLKKVKDNGVR